GCKVQMYGCGIGPIVYERDRRLAARIINDCVDKITLREPDSRETLSDFGVTDPEVILASTPRSRCRPQSAAASTASCVSMIWIRRASISASCCASGPALRKRPPCSPPALCTPT
ncbi:hypothetical protein LEA_13813, partial [human gut metagenome]